MPNNKKIDPVMSQVLIEKNQHHETRKRIFRKLETVLGRPVVSFFTSFKYSVMIEDDDADMLEGILQKMDLEKGLALLVSSPGGVGLSAERIIRACRSYSGTGEYWVIATGKAKSAATMICFGASKIYMGDTSELGPIDPQVASKDGKRYSVYNYIKSYEDLFAAAVKEKGGNLEPYLQQLGRYDTREIAEMRTALELSENIAIKSLASGMMKGMPESQIKKEIAMFLTPEKTKSHGRPIFRDEAEKCKLKIEKLSVSDPIWKAAYELYVRSNFLVNTRASKCIETKDHSWVTGLPPKGGN